MAKKPSAKAQSEVGSLFKQALTSAKPEAVQSSKSADLPEIGKPVIRAWESFTVIQVLDEKGNQVYDRYGNPKKYGETRYGEPQVFTTEEPKSKKPISFIYDIEKINADVTGAWDYIPAEVRKMISEKFPKALERYGKEMVAMTYYKMGQNGVSEFDKIESLQGMENLATKIENNGFKTERTVLKALGIEQQVLRFVVGAQIDYMTGNRRNKFAVMPMAYGQRKP